METESAYVRGFDSGGPSVGRSKNGANTLQNTKSTERKKLWKQIEM
jgi:hypothetical protein